MAGDERGDELFEDLDKFFAPIRDVDWDEPDEPASQTPAEEHVAVRTEPAATVRVPDEPEEPTPGEEAWYDTGQLEEIDEAVGEPVHETAATRHRRGRRRGRADRIGRGPDARIRRDGSGHRA